MAFLKNSELMNFALEDNAGVYKTDAETTDPNVRFREVDCSVEVESEDDSRYLTGDWGSTDENLTGVEMGTISYSLKLAPGEFKDETSPSAGDAEHRLNYTELLENGGLKVVEKGTSPTDTAPGTYTFFPSKTQASKTASFAYFMTESTSSGLNGRVEALRGVMSSLTLSVDGRGAPFLINGEGNGAVEKIEDIDEVDIPTYDDSTTTRTLGDKFLNTTVTITDVTAGSSPINLCLSSMTLDFASENTEIECQEGSGIKNYIITTIAPTMEIDPLLKTLSEFDYWTGLREEHTYRIEISSEHIDILIPRVQLNTTDVNETNGYMRNSLNFRTMRNIDSEIPSVLDTSDVDNAKEAMFFITIGESLADF